MTGYTSYAERIAELEQEISSNRRELKYARLDCFEANRKVYVERSRIEKAKSDLALAEKELIEAQRALEEL